AATPEPQPQPERPAARPPAQQPAPAPQDEIAALVAEAERAPAQPQPSAPAAQPAQGRSAAAAVSARTRSALVSGIRRHFSPLPGMRDARTVVVQFRVQLTADGRMAGAEVVRPSGALDSAHNAVRRQGLIALTRADEDGVFRLLAEEGYGAQPLLVNFTPEEITFL
ncbi:MAG: hypothetical protein EA355_01265, partial [Rhodobacteraceae bacterium]